MLCIDRLAFHKGTPLLLSASVDPRPDGRTRFFKSSESYHNAVFTYKPYVPMDWRMARRVVNRKLSYPMLGKKSWQENVSKTRVHVQQFATACGVPTAPNRCSPSRTARASPAR